MRKMLTFAFSILLLAGLLSAATITYKPAPRSVKVYLQYQAATGNGNVILTEGTVLDWTLTIVRNTGVTAGVVTLQVADDVAGPWARIQDVNLATYTGDSVPVSLHGRWHAIRFPITTTITGGATPWVTISAEGR